MRTRAGEAQHKIDDIAAREWLRQHQRALRLKRDGSGLDAAARQALEQVSAYQQQRVVA